MMRKRMLCAVLVFAVMFCCVFSAQASSAQDWALRWDDATSDASVISLSPGVDETQIRFRFLTPIGAKTAFRLADHERLTDADACEVKKSPTVTGQMCCTVIADGLKPDTTYYYACSVGGEWRGTYSFRTAGKSLTDGAVRQRQPARAIRQLAGEGRAAARCSRMGHHAVGSREPKSRYFSVSFCGRSGGDRRFGKAVPLVPCTRCDAQSALCDDDRQP